MSTCEKKPTSKQLPYFMEVNGQTPLFFSHIEEYFSQDIAPLYGDQTPALKKISTAKDRTSEILISPENQSELGIIVYKNALSSEFADIDFDNTFEIKTLFVINALKNSGKKIASKLLRRIAQKAVDLGAESIFVTVSSAKPETLAFFLSHGFRIATVKRNLYIEGLDEYFLFNPTPQKLLSTITFELLAKHLINTTALTKKFPSTFNPTIIEKAILSAYLSGCSLSSIMKETQARFGIQLDAANIQGVINTLQGNSLKWQSPELSSEYAIVFINPIFSQKDDQDEIGHLLVGISPQGKRHILASCPLNAPKRYWLNIFRRLKGQGLHKINIICGPQKIELPMTLNRLFHGARIGYSKALKKWYPENLSPKALIHELLDEMSFISGISAEEQESPTQL
ncbi:transposase [Simkania sp.]|uniref:transposase n=1 Tax=Simkania sp. TaxID=34094 RepID=UPI003B52CD54